MGEELSNKIKTNICKEYLETNISIEKLGYTKIYDCGLLKYEKIKETLN